MLGPIFVRELRTLPRRTQHYVARTAYLGVIWVLAITAWQAAIGWEQTATLGDTARFSLLLFQIVTFVQLTILLFFSALSTASNITTEKDRRTFVLLLMTDLRNHEIVLGKLLGSLLQILLLLSGTIPILALLLLLGGVAAEQIVQAVVVMAATALGAGSVGVLVALWRDKTFQALALTVLFLVLYLCLVRALAALPEAAALFGVHVSAAAVETAQQWLDPFLALQSVLEAAQNLQWGLTPAYGFVLSMLVLSAALNIFSIWKLRVWNPSGEPIMQRETPETETAEVGERGLLPVAPEAPAQDGQTVRPRESAGVGAQDRDRYKAHAAPGAARQVWRNPILWREMRTRAYGRRPLLVKLAYVLALALVCYYAVTPVLLGETHSPWAAAQGLVPVTILSLLLIAAQSVTAITNERDIGALDLLLVTDLTAPEFIFGKLGGICWNSKEYLLPPLLLAIFYAAYGMLALPREPGVNAEWGFCVTAALLVVMAFTMILGVHVALRTAISRLAVVHALGTVFFLSVGTLVCIYLILINGQFEYQWFSFLFFLAAGIGGLWWVLSGQRPSTALTLAAWFCPLAMFYTVTNILIGRPGTRESGDPLLPFLVITGAFGFTIAAMLVPMLSEFDTAMGRTTGEAD